MDKVSRASKFTGAVWGIGFAVALFVSVAALNMPREATDQELTDWYGVTGNLVSSVVSMFALFAAGALFLAFLGAVLSRLRVSDETGRLTSFAAAVGQVFASVLFVTGAVRGAVGKSVQFNNETLPAVGALRVLDSVSSALLGVYAMLAAALVIGAVSMLILRTDAFPRWLGILGSVCAAVLVLAQTTFVGELAIPVLLIWAIATSVQLRRQTPHAVEATRNSQAVSFS